MFNRQKAVLWLIQQAARPVTEAEVTGWTFLLREEMPSGGGTSFYDFLPSEEGPLSFCLRHEVGTLARDQYIKIIHECKWLAADDVEEVTKTLPSSIRRDCDRIVKRFESRSTRRYISQQHSRFAVNQNGSKANSHSSSPLAVYTTGYEGMSVDGMLACLLNHGIKQIVDVRRNPVARRFGFHKRTLARLAEAVDVSYHHMPELGISSSLRRNLSSLQDYEALLAVYEKTTLRENMDAVHAVADLVQQQPTALLCMEADPKYCHRTRVARIVSQLTDLKVLSVSRSME